jgi:hypothetical protein
VTSDPFGVRAASAAILASAEDVSLGPLDAAVAELRERRVPQWDRRRHYEGPRLLEYLLVLDTINFSFWGGEAGGYWQLAERLRDAFVGETPLWDPAFLRDLDAAALERLIGRFPLLEERAAALRELGSAADDLGWLVGSTAVETARRLAGLSSYDDRPFLKRAQIVPADLWGSGVRPFKDVAELTCFADYKLPQVLRHAGVLVYSERLARRVDDWVELAAGSREELEIRAATVVAVDLIRDRLAELGRPLMAVEVDWMLWAWSQGVFPVRPHHRTRTIFY